MFHHLVASSTRQHERWIFMMPFKHDDTTLVLFFQRLLEVVFVTCHQRRCDLWKKMITSKKCTNWVSRAIPYHNNSYFALHCIRKFWEPELYGETKQLPSFLALGADPPEAIHRFYIYDNVCLYFLGIQKPDILLKCKHIFKFITQVCYLGVGVQRKTVLNPLKCLYCYFSTDKHIFLNGSKHSLNLNYTFRSFHLSCIYTVRERKARS